MLKFIYKIIDKIHAWIAKQERDAVEDAIKNLCLGITNKYTDIKLKCYYDIEYPNVFFIHINELYAHNTAFKNYMSKKLNYFNYLFPDVYIKWDHYDPICSEYYDVKQHIMIYQYGF